jgi:DEAD/DEAH box helicase domain-containing protein
LDAQIGSLDIGDGEFIVVVPFTRASQQCSSTPVPSHGQSVNASKAPEVSAAADSAWKDIMDDLSAIPTTPQSDAAYKDFSSRVSCSEDLTTFHGSSNGSSRKRRKTCKEDGNVPTETLPPMVNGTSEKRNMSKKSGMVKSAASSCHVNVHSFFYLPLHQFKPHRAYKKSKLRLNGPWPRRMHWACVIPIALIVIFFPMGPRQLFD